jgi:hypothetical protein
MLTELEAKHINLRDTLLRISGAMQVLGELLSDAEQGNDNQIENSDPSNMENQEGEK